MERQEFVASVLVIAVDPSIEFLMGQLVAFAGHRPIFDPAIGAAGEAIRRIRPDVAMLDVSVPPPVVEACLSAAAEVGTRPVLTSSVNTSNELAEEARARHALYFSLPGGPKPLASVIDRAVHERRGHAQVTIPVPRGDGTVHRALCAALAGVARANVLRMRIDALQRVRRSLHSDMREAVDEMEKSHDALKAAITDYARQLRASATPESGAVVQMRAAMNDCAGIVGAVEVMETVLDESEAWTRAAYH